MIPFGLPICSLSSSVSCCTICVVCASVLFDFSSIIKYLTYILPPIHAARKIAEIAIETIAYLFHRFISFWQCSILSFSSLRFVSSSHSIPKSSVMDTSKISASNFNFSISGMALSVSHLDTDCRDTPIFSASCSCVIDRFVLNLYIFSPNVIFSPS